MTSPLISVIVPVYNREEYIAVAIASILNQTFTDFEILVVDDASIDSTAVKIREINDPRIKIIRSEVNQGVAAARNRGIREAKGTFIAFMDSDDISFPERFEKQITFFRKNPDVSACGSWMMLFGGNEIIKYKEYHSDICIQMLLHCSVSITTFMFRRCQLQKYNFNTSLRFGEDYEFWSRFISEGVLYNIQEPLVLYRNHERQLSSLNKKEQIKMDIDIRLRMLKKLEYSTNDFPDKLLKNVFLLNSYVSTKDFFTFLEWLKCLKKKNSELKIFPEQDFNLLMESMRSRLIYRIFYTKSALGANYIWKTRVLMKLRWNETKLLLKYLCRQQFKYYLKG